MFCSNGMMSSAANLQFYGNSKNKQHASQHFMISTKPQYAGIEMHKMVIHLLKYLGRYLHNFTALDEGYYWETGAEKLPEDAFGRYTALIESFTFSVQHYPTASGERMSPVLRDW